MNETRWSLLGVRLEILRDLVGWLSVVALGIGAICAYDAVQDLRRSYKSQGIHVEWYRYVYVSVSGAGIALLIGGMFVCLAILLTAGIRVTGAFGEAAGDDDPGADDYDDADGDVVEVGDVE